MGGKKNKKAKKPAVGNPAAGSNNKRDKKEIPQKKSVPQPVKNNSERSRKNEQEQKKRKESVRENEKNFRKPEAAVAEKTGKKSKSEKVKKQRPEKAPDSEKIKKERTEKSLKIIFEDFKAKYNITRIAAALCVLVIIVVAVFAVIGAVSGKNYDVPEYAKDAEFKGRLEPESVAFNMDISANQQETLSKAIKARGDRRAFGFFINDTVNMAESDDPVLIEFGSVSSNDCVLLIFMFDENGNEIYRSLGIEPGEQINSVSLFEELPYGTHEITLAVSGYNPKTYKNVGMQTMKITLKIGVD